MDVDELIATLKHGRPLCSFEVDGAIELVERLKAENAELKKNVELAVENHQICSLMDAGLIERKHRHIQDLEKENADLRKCWKCGKDDCNHRNLVAVEQVELLAVRLELSSLKAENDKLRREVNTKEVELFALQSGFGHCDDEYNKQIERLQSENDKLRQAMEWISVEDRLPNDECEVMVSDGEVIWSTSLNISKGMFTDPWGNPEDKINHWQPLPAPPVPTDEGGAG